MVAITPPQWACRRCRSERRSTLWRERIDGPARQRLAGRPRCGNFSGIWQMMAVRKARKLTCGTAFAIVAVALGATSDWARAANVAEVNSGRPDLTVFLIEGVIQGGETLALEGLVGKLPPSKSVAVILNSPGGNLDEGMKLGRSLHRARIATFVLGYGGGCYSACAIAFLGGRGHDGRPSRTKMTGGNLGYPSVPPQSDCRGARQEIHQGRHGT